MSLESQSPVVASPHIHKLLERLHSQSTSQETALDEDGTWGKIKSQFVANPSGAQKFANDVMRDKFIALESDKSQFVYQLLRATRALNVVEVGTSFGVSTIYLALAVGQNATDAGKGPEAAKVVGTEWEATKATKAREFWSEAGEEVKKWVELLEGDCRETLNEKLGSDRTLDFVLMDIWTPMVLPTLKVLESRLKPGAVILTDNTISSKEGYRPFFDYITEKKDNYRTMTLPFHNGFEMTVYHP